MEHRGSDEEGRQRAKPKEPQTGVASTHATHASEHGRSVGGAKVSTQSRRRETLHHERRRQDGQVILRSNFPRGSQPPTGNW